MVVKLIGLDELIPKPRLRFLELNKFFEKFQIYRGYIDLSNKEFNFSVILKFSSEIPLYRTEEEKIRLIISRVLTIDYFQGTMKFNLL